MRSFARRSGRLLALPASRFVWSKRPAMRPVKHHLKQPVLAANRFQRRLARHLELALNPPCEAFQQRVGVSRYRQGSVDTAVERNLLNRVTMLESERQYGCIRVQLRRTRQHQTIRAARGFKLN